MTGKVITLASSNGITPDMRYRLEQFEAQLIDNIAHAKSLGVPQGLIVALLHAHTHIETVKLVE